MYAICIYSTASNNLIAKSEAVELGATQKQEAMADSGGAEGYSRVVGSYAEARERDVVNPERTENRKVKARTRVR